ncbi:hypothetical protein BGP_5811 [Beggiatoa sp. PS]|nr:hypothetical protein BGP_5811 [Beggiatoa sp. PS]
MRISPTKLSFVFQFIGIIKTIIIKIPTKATIFINLKIVNPRCCLFKNQTDSVAAESEELISVLCNMINSPYSLLHI